jgi:16S rRNA (guanine966-N2)-methyltransferase
VPDAGRIVTGSAKGLRLDTPGEGTRPLSDRLKQSLFGALSTESALTEGGAFLDLFAGSGAAGIEALSRGAALAVFVEHDARACRVIAANLRRSGLAGGKVVRMDVLRFLHGARPSDDRPFDACLLDPPYNQALVMPALGQLSDPSNGWLMADAIVVAKHFWRDRPGAAVGNLRAYRERRYGESMLTFYRAAADAGGTETP